MFKRMMTLIIVSTMCIIGCDEKSNEVYATNVIATFDYSNSKCKVMAVNTGYYTAAKFIVCDPPIPGMIQCAPTVTKYDQN